MENHLETLSLFQLLIGQRYSHSAEKTAQGNQKIRPQAPAMPTTILSLLDVHCLEPGPASGAKSILANTLAITEHLIGVIRARHLDGRDGDRKLPHTCGPQASRRLPGPRSSSLRSLSGRQGFEESQRRNFREFKFGNVLVHFKFSNFISAGAKNMPLARMFCSVK